MEFNPLNSLLIWGSKKMVTCISVPRKYTSTHDDEKRQIYLSINHVYNAELLNTEEVKKVESQVLGEWERCKCGKYKIFLTVQVSTPQNPNAAVRDMIFRRELPSVLHTIALAEQGLMTVHPSLKKTPIYILFESIDPAYCKKEKWGVLGDY